MIDHRKIPSDSGQGIKEIVQCYKCNLCGHEEMKKDVSATKIPFMHGVLVSHGEPPGIDFVNCQASDVHCCYKCLRAMQVTFQFPQDMVVVRSRG